MKITFISCTNGLVYRGVETFVHELANSLAAGNEVTVFQAGEKLDGAKYKTVKIPFVFDLTEENRLRSLSAPLNMDFNFKNIVRRFYFDYWNRKQGEFTLKALKIMPSNIDYLIIPGSGWVGFFCRLWCWKNHSKLIIAGQSGPGWDDRINLWCRPDAFVALSNLAADWAKKAGFGIKVATIPNGVSLDKFNLKVPPAKINLPRPLFLTVAALESGKRIDLTIKAVNLLKNGSLLVLGDGKEKDNLQNLGNKLLPNRFAIKYVKPEEMPSYYAVADVVTMVPVGVESFGLVFIEGMALNKPIVTTDDPIRREIIGEAGFFVNPKDSKEYSKALQEALNKDWGTIPRQRAEKFDWSEIAKKYDQVFRDIAGL